MIASVARESSSTTGGQAAVMLGAALLVVVAGCALWLYRQEIGQWLRRVRRLRLSPSLDLDGELRRDVARAAARTRAGSGRWVG